MKKVSKHDQRIADEGGGGDVDRSLMCIASRCPNRWSFDAGQGKLCSVHAWSPRHQWPFITDELLERAERALAAPPPPPQQRPADPQDIRERLDRLRLVAGGASDVLSALHCLQRLRSIAARRPLTIAQRDAVTALERLCTARAAATAQIDDPVAATATFDRQADAAEARQAEEQRIADYARHRGIDMHHRAADHVQAPS